MAVWDEATQPKLACEQVLRLFAKKKKGEKKYREARKDPAKSLLAGEAKTDFSKHCKIWMLVLAGFDAGQLLAVLFKRNVIHTIFY